MYEVGLGEGPVVDVWLGVCASVHVCAVFSSPHHRTPQTTDTEDGTQIQTASYLLSHEHVTLDISLTLRTTEKHNILVRF